MESILTTATASVIPVVPVVWPRVFRLVGVFSWRCSDYGCNCKVQTLVHLTCWVVSSKWSCQKAKSKHCRFSASQLAPAVKSREHLLNPWLWSHTPTPSLNTPKLAMWGTCSRPCLFLSSWELKPALLSPPVLFVQGEYTLGQVFVSRAT